MNSKQIALFVALLLILTGLIGLSSPDETVAPPVQQGGVGSQEQLEVKTGNNLPASTIDLIQGSGNLQGQGQQPQSLNAGSQLQPNAGADSLPDGY